jgi:hypothetical protein
LGTTTATATDARRLSMKPAARANAGIAGNTGSDQQYQQYQQ